jgi:hypothetical protein
MDADERRYFIVREPLGQGPRSSPAEHSQFEAMRRLRNIANFEKGLPLMAVDIHLSKSPDARDVACETQRI